MDHLISTMGAYMADKKSVSLRATAYKKPVIEPKVQKIEKQAKPKTTTKVAAKTKKTAKKHK